MKGGRQREGGERARASRGGLEFPAAIRNGDRDGKRERPIHTVGFFPHLKSVYLYFSLWFLFCSCAFFFCVCVKPIDSVFLKTFKTFGASLRSAEGGGEESFFGPSVFLFNFVFVLFFGNFIHLAA